MATVAGAEHGVKFRVRAPLLELSKADIIRQELVAAGFELEDFRREDGSVGTKVYSTGHPRVLVWTA